VTNPATNGKSRPKPQHVPMDQFAVVDNCLQVGDMPLTELAAQMGDTPFYAYDRRVIDAQLDKLRGAMPEDLHIHYAMKANPMPGVVNYLAQRTDGLDVASGGELQVALASGIKPGRISFAGPGKAEDELILAIQNGVTINMESEGEMARIAALAGRLEITPQVAIRVNPDFELKASGMKMAGGPKPFGVDAERVPDMLASLASLPLQFKGFHIFCGSQNLRAEAIIEAQTNTFELAFRLAEYAPTPVQWLNIGGGLGCPIFPEKSGWNFPRSPIISPNYCKIRRTYCQMQRLSWSWVATWLPRRAFMYAELSIARYPGARHSWSPTAACITTWRPRVILARSFARITRRASATGFRPRSWRRSALSARCARRWIFWRTK